MQVLHGKFSGTVTSATKAKLWDELAKEVSAVSGIVRTADDLKKKWTCLRSELKAKAAAVKRSVTTTGGGAGVDDLSGMEERVVHIIGDVCVEGVVGGVDTAGN